MNGAALAAMVLGLEALIGYPGSVQKAVGHPVEWIGRLINFLDDGLNDADANFSANRINGAIALTALLACCVLPALMIQSALSFVPHGWILNVLVATPFVAQKSLVEHVAKVARALPLSLVESSLEIAKIVGRDTGSLDQSGIAKAALESLAESTSDGVVAPLLWYALLGLPGLVAYKAINTADSMIGHKTEKYLNFGWAAAKLDDVVNLPASRLSGLLFVAAARLRGKSDMQRAWVTMRRDAPNHQSPNAGWPEAAMAGALGLSFGGERHYAGEAILLPKMGNGPSPNGTADIEQGVTLFHNAMALLFAGLVIMAVAL